MWKLNEFSVSQILREISYMYVAIIFVLHSIIDWALCFESSILIWRKIWVEEKFPNFHSVSFSKWMHSIGKLFKSVIDVINNKNEILKKMKNSIAILRQKWKKYNSSRRSFLVLTQSISKCPIVT